jgi:Helix-turn-helix domain
MSWPHIFGARDGPPPGLTPAQRHVLLVVATYTNQAGRTWLAADTLAAATGYHPGSVRRIVAGLEAETSGLVIPNPGRTHHFDLAHLARGTPRILRETPRRLRDVQGSTRLKTTGAARGQPGEIVPAAWRRLADPALLADVLALAEQLRLEV